MPREVSWLPSLLVRAQIQTQFTITTQTGPCARNAHTTRRGSHGDAAINNDANERRQLVVPVDRR